MSGKANPSTFAFIGAFLLCACGSTYPDASSQDQRITSSTASLEAKDGESCGGFQDIKCESGLKCVLSDVPGIANDCSVTDRAGVCSQAEGICGAEYEPVCGCDGVTYSSFCIMAGVGATFAYAGECQNAQDQRFCVLKIETQTLSASSPVPTIVTLKTDKLTVTKDAHEEARTVTLRDKNGTEQGTAMVNTGTVSDADGTSAFCTTRFTIDGAEQSLTVASEAMSTRAKASTFYSTEDSFVVVTVTYGK